MRKDNTNRKEFYQLKLTSKVLEDSFPISLVCLTLDNNGDESNRKQLQERINEINNTNINISCSLKDQ